MGMFDFLKDQPPWETVRLFSGATKRSFISSLTARAIQRRYAKDVG
jgi:hypothetical protein